jgi:hypothetical protein
VDQKCNRKTINEKVAGGSNIGGSVPPGGSTISGRRSPQTSYRIEVQGDGQKRHHRNYGPLNYRGDYFRDRSDELHDIILALINATP